MAEQLNCPPNNKEADAESISARRIEPLEALKDPRQLFGSHAETRIVDVDPHVRARRRPPIKIRPPDSVYLTALRTRLRRMPSNSTQVASDRGARRTNAQVDALFQRGFLVLIAYPPKQRRQRD